MPWLLPRTAGTSLMPLEVSSRCECHLLPPPTLLASHEKCPQPFLSWEIQVIWAPPSSAVTLPLLFSSMQFQADKYCRALRALGTKLLLK